MKKGRGAIYPICWFHNVNIRELVDKDKYPHGEFLLDSTDLMISDLPRKVQSGRENENSHHDVLAFEGVEDAVALDKQVIKPEDCAHPFCSASQPDRCYEVL